MLNTDIAMSDMQRLTKNFHNSDDIRSPFMSTTIVIILKPKDIKAVIEYRIISMTCEGQKSSASRGGIELLDEFRDIFWLKYQNGSIFSDTKMC